ncbi:hypothetical protein Tco_0026889 [Tanacetum coccineum]
MNTTQAQHKALDDALVIPMDCLEFGKCNRRFKTNIKPKEATFQVATVSVHKSSIRFTINKKKVSLDVDMFREILQFCPKIPGQKFEDLPLEHDILSFIRDLGHSRDIICLTDVNVDYLDQPWRAFATIINKCLSGKETGMEKIRLSRAQILWGMFYKKNIDYVYLLWEDFLFQIEYKDAKNTNKMSYPRFTKIIIDYFMSKDQSISRRNKMSWHTARDDNMFTSMRCISIHEDTQVYDTILPKELTNQAMLESKAYMTYYAFASGEKAPKPKYVRKKADPNTSPKKKAVQATKGTRLKLKAKVAKPDKKKQPAKKIKAKGLAVLSKSKVPDEQQKNSSSTNEGIGTIPGVPDVPIYESKSEKESWGDSEDEDEDEDEDDDNDYDDLSDEGDDDNDGNNGNDGDDDDANDDDKQEGDDTNNDDEETDSDRTERRNIDDEEMIYDDEDDEVTKDLYEYVNVDLGNEDTEMTNADQGASEQQNVSQESGFEQVEEDAHVTLTLVLDTQKADEPDNEIASLMETSARHSTAVPEITFGFTTYIPPPSPFFNPLLQHATPAPTPTTSEATTLFTSLPDFASVFKFNERVTNLEKDLSEIKEEAQAEKKLYIELIDSTVRIIIKEEVNAQLPHILPQAISDVVTPIIEKNVIESLEAAILTRSSSQPQSLYEAAATLFEFELTKILIDKMERNKSYDTTDHKRELYDALDKSYQIDKDFFDSYGEVFSLKRSRDDRDKDRGPSARSDRGKKRSLPMQRSQVILLKTQTWISQVARAEEPPTSFDEFNDTSFDFSAFVMNRLKIPNLTQEILGGDLSRRYSTFVTKTKAATYELKWIEDLAPELWSPVQLKYDQHFYSRRRIIAVTRLKVTKKYDYGHLKEIEVRRDDQKLYTFKEGDFKRLRLQDIEDLLLLLIQQKLTNLTINKRYIDIEEGLDSMILGYRQAASSEEFDAESRMLLGKGITGV